MFFEKFFLIVCQSVISHARRRGQKNDYFVYSNSLHTTNLDKCDTLLACLNKIRPPKEIPLLNMK